jgi:predicted aldo/keto reductase-like oxidoreductase
MERRMLGRTGLEVSVLGVGGHTYPVGEGASDYATHEQRASVVARLLEGGVNYFDTTWLNELELLVDSFKRLGVLGRVHQSTAPAERIVVSLQSVDGCTDLPPEPRARLREEVTSRLALLELDAAPLFIVGMGNGHPTPARVADICAALAELVAEGLIEHAGMSCHDVTAFDTIADAIEGGAALDYLMLRFNPKWPQAARLLQVAARENIGVVGMKVFCWDCPRDANPASGHPKVLRYAMFNFGQR